MFAVRQEAHGEDILGMARSGFLRRLLGRFGCAKGITAGGKWNVAAKGIGLGRRLFWLYLLNHPQLVAGCDLPPADRAVFAAGDADFPIGEMAAE